MNEDKMYTHDGSDDFPVTIPMSAEYCTYLGAAAKFCCFSMHKYFIQEALKGHETGETCFITMSNHDWKFINCLSGWLNASYRQWDDFAAEFAQQIGNADEEMAKAMLAYLPVVCNHIGEYMVEVEKQYIERNK